MFNNYMIIAITALVIFSSEYCFSQSNETGQTMNDIQTNNVSPVYLDKNDPIFISIKSRAVSDLKQSVERAAPESPENKLIAVQVKSLTEAKQNELQALAEQSIYDYTAQTLFDAGTFLLVFDILGKRDPKEIEDEYDFRVQYLGGTNYVAEFWEDGLAVNSEAHAIAWAHELSISEYARKHPDSGVGDVEVIKETYSNVRESIKNGDQQRYTKVMALLYSKNKAGLVTFHDPNQPIIDFVNTNSK